MMRLALKMHEGMMTVTGKWSDGEIGGFRFAVGYYSRFILVLVLGCTYGLIQVIIEQRRDGLAQATNDERTPNGRSNQEEIGSSKAVYAH